MAIINYDDNNNYYFIETQNVQNPGHGDCIVLYALSCVVVQ